MKKASLLVLVLATAMISSGCASIFSKSTYPISISSNPISSVSVTDSNGMEIFKGSTPATVTLKAGNGFFKRAVYQIKFSKAGYDEKIVPVNFKVDGWYWGNILLGGVIGMLIVDPATGAMYKLEENFINETLTQTVAKNSKDGLKVYGLEEIPATWKAHLVLLK